MSWGESLSSLAREVATLYKEIATTSVRFDVHAERTRETLSQYRQELDAMSGRIARIEEEHVRERAALDARVDVLEGRLSALSEQALHAVAREAARELMREAIQARPGSELSGQG